MITEDLIDFLSWTLPGGISLVPVAIFIFSFIWFVTWRGTEFWSKSHFYKMLWQVNLGIIALYIVMWMIFRPPPIPVRVIVWGENSATAHRSLPDSLHDPRVTAIVDQIERRLAASPKTFVRINSTLSPVFARSKPDRNELYRLASLMKVKWIIDVHKDDSGAKYIADLSRYDGDESFEKLHSVSLQAEEFLQSATGLSDDVIKLLGDDSEPLWKVQHPSIADEDVGTLFTARHLYLTDRTDSAATLLNDLIERHPNWKQPHQELGKAYLSIGLGRHSVEALNSIIAAIELDQTDALSYTLLGRYFLKHRDWTEAESALKLGLNYDQDDPQNYFYLSRLGYNRLQNLPWRTGELLLKRALQIAPGYEDAELTLSRWYYDRHYYRFAKDVLDKGIEIDPHAIKLLLAYSVADLGLGNTEAAIEHCEKILSFDPVHPQAWHNIGQILLRTYKYEEAIVAFDSSYTNGGTTDNLYCTGLALERLKRYEEALSYYQKRLGFARDRDDRTAKASRDQIVKVKSKIRLRDKAIADSMAATNVE